MLWKPPKTMFSTEGGQEVENVPINYFSSTVPDTRAQGRRHSFSFSFRGFGPQLLCSMCVLMLNVVEAGTCSGGQLFSHSWLWSRDQAGSTQAQSIPLRTCPLWDLLPPSSQTADISTISPNRATYWGPIIQNARQKEKFILTSQPCPKRDYPQCLFRLL